MQPEDSEMAYRVDRHKHDRPATRQTIEESVDIADVISNCTNDIIIIDYISMWVPNILFKILGDFNEINEEFDEKQFLSIDNSLDEYSKKIITISHNLSQPLTHRCYVSQMKWGLALFHQH